MSDFIFVTCQIGAEGVLKKELARRWPAFRLAFSRPGFLTFKLPPDHGLAEDFDLESVFAQAYGFSLGKVTKSARAGRFSGQYDEQTLGEMTADVWKAVEGRAIQRIHVWQKDARAPGDHGFEPSLSEEASNVHRLLVEACPHPEHLTRGARYPHTPARAGESILDCVLLAPESAITGQTRFRRFIRVG